mmetsp:Transcript_62709/g.123187  ORF Transcript_62709/g.123187 Transcript_62709/m.123187 type:complete len:218 (-) Transcript_62709:76-729(-)
MEVLWEPHGLQGPVWRRGLHSSDLRRGELRHRVQPHPREGRALGGALLAPDPRRCQPRREPALGVGASPRGEALGGVRPQLLHALRLRGRGQDESGGHVRGDARHHGPGRRKVVWGLHRGHRRRLHVPGPGRRERVQEARPALPHGLRQPRHLPLVGHRGVGGHGAHVPGEVRARRGQNQASHGGSDGGAGGIRAPAFGHQGAHRRRRPHGHHLKAT